MGEPGQGPRSGRVGPYRIARRLGAGGMGVVYLGHDDTSGTEAAVKLIRPEHSANPSFRARLRREVTAARRVPRFCTAPVLAADLEADQPWLATEYIDGPSLDVAMLEEGTLAGPRLEAFAVSIAAALRAIHGHGVIHRDLKPSNVLLSRQGPRVIDFGIARVDGAETQLTQTGVLVGTPAYMAPEQLGSEPATAAVDVFAWASLVTYAATGRPPFGSGDGALYAILHAEPDLGALAEPLRGLVAAAFGKEPVARPSAAELVDRLSRSAAEVTTQVLAAAAAPPNLAAPTPRPVALSPVPPPPGPVAPPPVPPRTATPPPVPAPQRPRRRWLLAGLGAAAVPVLAAMVLVPIWLLPDGSSGGPGPVASGEAAGPTARQSQQPSPGDGETDAGEEVDLPRFGSQIGDVLTGHTGSVDGLAVGEVDGTPVAVSGGGIGDRTVRVWDLTDGEELHTLIGHTGRVSSVVVGELDGTPIAVSGGTLDSTQSVGAFDHTVRVWDLAGGEELRVLTGHTDLTTSVVLGELDGDPVAVSASYDATVRVWDLASGETIRTLTGHSQVVYSVALGELDGDPIAVTGGYDGTLRVWDLDSGEQLRAITVYEGDDDERESVWSVAVSELDGTPVAISGGGDETVRFWDLTSGEQVGEPLRGPKGQYVHVATGELDGTPVVVVAGTFDSRLFVWNLETGERIGEPFTGHSGAITAVAIGVLDGVPVAVSGATDQTVRVWSLAQPPGLDR